MFTFDDLKKSIEELMTDSMNEADSTLQYYTVYGDVYLLILRYCNTYDIKIGNYDVKHFLQELTDSINNKIKIIEFYDKIVFFFQDICDDVEAGKLNDSPEFLSIFDIYFKLNDNKCSGARFDPTKKKEKIRPY